jgi:hypothetical protein
VQRGLSPCTLAQKASFPFRSIYDFSPFILSVIVTLSLHQAVVVEQQATCAHVQVRVRICVCVASISHIYLINQLVLVNLPTQQGIKPRPKSEPAPVYLPYSTYYPCSVCVCVYLCIKVCIKVCAQSILGGFQYFTLFITKSDLQEYGQSIVKLVFLTLKWRLISIKTIHTYAYTHRHTRDTITHMTRAHIHTQDMIAQYVTHPSAVPLTLFSNGVWIYGKQFWKGNVRKVVPCVHVPYACVCVCTCYE